MSLSHRRGKDWVHPSKAESLILSRPINPLQRAVRVKTGKRLEKGENFGARFVYNLPNVGYDMTIYCQPLRRRYLRIPSRLKTRLNS
jgi:hypothetical protein